ncbi:MAG: ABC transporter substrate-binding protein [Phycisphaeraceae bacterium]
MSYPARAAFVARLLLALAAAGLAMGLLVQVLARASNALHGTTRVAVSADERRREDDRLERIRGREPVSHHRVSEWPADRPRVFAEAPALAALVEAGALPPVAERLPDEPLVIHPPEQVGPYGGTWRRYANSASDAGIFEQRIAYDFPLRWDAAAEYVLPNLVRAWEVDDVGQVFTLHLRRGVRWSDGHPFTADDILFWYEAVLKHPQLTAGTNRDLQRAGELVDVDKLDEHTVRFSFAQPHGMFIRRFLTGSNDMLLPRHYLAQFHPDYREREPDEAIDAEGVPASLAQIVASHGHQHWTQTFTFKDRWQNVERPVLTAWRVTRPPPSRPVIYERNPYYWKVDPEGNQLPYIDRVQFEIYDTEIMNLRIVDGLMDMQTRHIRFEYYPLFMQNRGRGNYRVAAWSTLSGNQLVIGPNLNHRDPVMREIIGDRRFRIALSHALDRELINEAKFHGQHVPQQVAPSESSDYYVPGYADAYIEHDPAKAEALLDEMGLTRPAPGETRRRPDGRPLRLRIDTTQAPSGGDMAAQLIAEAWRDVGIRAEVNRLARPLFTQRKDGLMHDVILWEGEAEDLPFLDPRWIVPYVESYHAVDYARWFMSGGTAGTEPTGALREVIELYKEAEVTPDHAAQAELFRQIIALNREHLWAIGTVGRGPVPVIIHERMRNVPDHAVASWVLRSPGNTATECYAIDPSPAD